MDADRLPQTGDLGRLRSRSRNARPGCMGCTAWSPTTAPMTDRDRPWLTRAVIGIAQLLLVLEMTIVNIALPSAQGPRLLRRQPAVDRQGVRARVRQPAAARRPDRRPVRRKWTFIAGLLGKAFGVYGAIAGAGGAFGLLPGGILTEVLDWRWCLYGRWAGSIGTALLSTMAVSATTDYLAANGPQPIQQAAVERYTTTFGWAAAIVAVGAHHRRPAGLRRAAADGARRRRAGGHVGLIR